MKIYHVNGPKGHSWCGVKIVFDPTFSETVARTDGKWIRGVGRNRKVVPVENVCANCIEIRWKNRTRRRDWYPDLEKA